MEQSLAASEEQELIRDAARAFLEQHEAIRSVRRLRDSDDARGFPPGLWSGATELGWPGLLVPAEAGGAELGLAELGVVCEALGRHLAPTPMLSTGVLAASCLALADGRGAHRQLLREIAAGKCVVALAWEEEDRFAPTAIATQALDAAGGFAITGRKVFVLDGAAADALIVVARTGEPGSGDADLSLFLVDPGAPGFARTTTKLLDGRRAAQIELRDLRVPPGALIGERGAAGAHLEKLVDRAAAALAAEMVGLMARSFEMTLAFLQSREQFGRPLASFQALQHRAARMFAEIERSVSLVQDALVALDEGREDASAAASAAKAHVSEVARHVTGEALQLHGGLGMTDEHDIGLYYKRARIASACFGDAAFHYDRFARHEGF